VTYEWDPIKAAANAKKHRVAFEEAASVFLDPSALTFSPSTPKRKIAKSRSVVPRGNACSSWHTLRARTASESSAHDGRPAGSRPSMRKELAKRRSDDLRPEYDLARLKGGVRGKYYKQAAAGTNLVLLEPDVARAFPDSTSVNRALRLLQEVATKSSRNARAAAGARRKATG